MKTTKNHEARLSKLKRVPPVLDGDHGVPHQINAVILDKHSRTTSKGKHNRITVFGDKQTGLLSAREDIIGLQYATPADVEKIAFQDWPELKATQKYSSSEFLESNSNTSAVEAGYITATVWHYFKRIND